MKISYMTDVGIVVASKSMKIPFRRLRVWKVLSKLVHVEISTFLLD